MSPEVKPYRRRSARLPIHVQCLIRWTDFDGGFHEELTETYLLSRHGGLVKTATRLKPGDPISVWWPQEAREAEATIVFRRLDSTSTLVEIAFEFVETENFWKIEFPPDKTAWEHLRSA